MQSICAKVFGRILPLLRELAGRILPWAGDVCRYEAAALCRAVTAGAAKKGWLVIMTMMFRRRKIRYFSKCPRLTMEVCLYR